MGDTIVIRYGRKQTDKLGDGSFDSIELGVDLTLELKNEDNPLQVYGHAHDRLAEAVEAKLAEYQPREIKGTHTPTPYGKDEQPIDTRPAEQAPEEAPKASDGGRGWIEDQVKTNTAAIQERMSSIPGEKITGGGGPIDEYGTPSTAVIVKNEAVAFQRCRVFEVEAKTASNGNPFVSIRIGKRGEDGIPGQYTTARSFEADVIKQVAYFDKEEKTWNYKFRNGDFVDVWGYFKPWKGDDTKFDLELQKIQLHEE